MELSAETVHVCFVHYAILLQIDLPPDRRCEVNDDKPVENGGQPSVVSVILSCLAISCTIYPVDIEYTLVTQQRLNGTDTSFELA